MEEVNWQIVTTVVGLFVSVAALFWKIGQVQADNKAAHDGINQRIKETNEATQARITETNAATQTRISDVYGLLQALLKQESKG